MCLACEMDALWFAEMEAAAGATSGSAGATPALSGEIAPLRGGPAPSSRLPSGRLRQSETGYGEGRGEGDSPQAQTRGEPTSPGMSAKDALIPTSRFGCEETRSE
jgi:hypothetical protein